jgi:ABC-type Mn2+/Zn2+ transport system ATPase subunit
LPIESAVEEFEQVKLNKREEQIAGPILREIKNRLGFLNTVGLGYLTLDRTSSTLSGGEGQRIRLATQIGSQLRGVLYVPDEPSIGLHPRDNQKLPILFQRCETSATVLVVEHDEETIQRQTMFWILAREPEHTAVKSLLWHSVELRRIKLDNRPVCAAQGKSSSRRTRPPNGSICRYTAQANNLKR